MVLVLKHGSNTCYIKFGAVKSGPDSGRDFENLLIACEIFATEHGLTHITAGVNTARHQAYTRMLANSFRTDMLGIVMQREMMKVITGIMFIL